MRFRSVTVEMGIDGLDVWAHHMFIDVLGPLRERLSDQRRGTEGQYVENLTTQAPQISETRKLKANNTVEDRERKVP